MHRSSVIMTVILALLLTTSGAVLMGSVSSAENKTVEKQWDNFLVSLGTDHDPTGGETDWTQISTTADLIAIYNDLEGKYYLTNNIDLTAGGVEAPITSPVNLNAEHGMNAVFVPKIDEEYEIKEITSSAPMPVSKIAYNTVTVSEVDADCTMTNAVAKTTHNVTIVSNSGGTTSPSGVKTVAHGASVTITFTPDLGYRLNDVTVDGISTPDAVNEGSLTLTVTKNVTIRASFSHSEDDDETVYLTVNAGDGGSATGSGGYPRGTPVTISATPADGYRFVEWSDGNTSQERVITVHEDMTITAHFESSSGGGDNSSSSGWWWWILLLILLIIAAIIYYEWKKNE